MSSARIRTCLLYTSIDHLLKLHYTQFGEVKQLNQSAVTLHEIYELYMPQNGTANRQADLANHILTLAIEKSAGLLKEIGGIMATEFALPSSAQSHTKACLLYTSRCV